MPEAVRAKPQRVFAYFWAVPKVGRIGMRNIPFVSSQKSLASEGETFLIADRGRFPAPDKNALLLFLNSSDRNVQLISCFSLPKEAALLRGPHIFHLRGRMRSALAKVLLTQNT